MTRSRPRKPPPDPHALAAAYQLDPSLRRWNALVEALRIPAERGSPYRNGPDRDPTAQIAVSNVDRERKLP